MRNKSLQPIVISYTTPNKKYHQRRHYIGSYRVSYDTYVDQSHSIERPSFDKTIQNKKRSLTFNHHLKTQPNQGYTEQKGDNMQYPPQLYHSRHHTQQCKIGNPQQNQLNKKLAIASKQFQINLPKIGRLQYNNKTGQSNCQKSSEKTTKPHIQSHYHCGDNKCERRRKPKQIKRMRIKTKQQKQEEQRLIAWYGIRRRYTPTYVCSDDNPLPVYKVYPQIQ